MKANIFVEGETDERLLTQYCQKLQDEGIINRDYEIVVQKVSGWTILDSPKGEAMRNILKRNTDGKNLLVYDADLDPETRRMEILFWKEKYNIEFELFLFPDDKTPGAVETLLERIINPANQCVIDCWHEYEDNLSTKSISWKEPPQPTCPSEKSKIYGYLEALVGKTESEKDKIKDRNRDFTEKKHWNLDAEGILPLKDFLTKNLK